MSPAMGQIDDKLDEWGSRLFNVSTETSHGRVAARAFLLAQPSL